MKATKGGKQEPKAVKKTVKRTPIDGDDGEPLTVPPESQGFQIQDQMRKACTQYLDVVVPHSICNKKADKWKSLKATELRKIYDTRREHIMGYNASLEWWKEHKTALQDLRF